MTIRNVPDIYQRTYNKAMSGKSRKAGIKAFCLSCVGYSRNEVALCTDTECPLRPYRPFKHVKKIDETTHIISKTPL